MVQGRLEVATLASLVLQVLLYSTLHTVGTKLQQYQCKLNFLKQISVLSYTVYVSKWNTLTWSSAACELGCPSFLSTYNMVEQNPESYIQIPTLVKEEGYQDGARNLFILMFYHVLVHYWPAREINRKNGHGTKKVLLKTGFMLISCGNAYGS